MNVNGHARGAGNLSPRPTQAPQAFSVAPHPAPKQATTLVQAPTASIRDIFDTLLPAEKEDPIDDWNEVIQPIPASEIERRWFEPTFDARLDLNLLTPKYGEEDFTHSIVMLQNMIDERKKLKSRVDLTFRHELPNFLRSAIGAAPELLDVADEFDEALEVSAAIAGKLRRPRKVGQSSIKLLQLDRRRANLRRVIELEEMTEVWNSKTRVAVDYIDRCEFATAATILGVRLYNAGVPLQQKKSEANLARARELSNNGAASGVFPAPSGPEGNSGVVATSGKPTSVTDGLSSPTRNAEREGDSDLEFEMWSSAVGFTILPLIAGKAALQRWHRLMSGGVEVLVGRTKALLASQFDAQAFSERSTILLLRGLRAMQVQNESVLRFILEGYQEYIDRQLCLTLTDVIGENTITWETTADILRPSELELCSLSFLKASVESYQAANRLQQFFLALRERSTEEDVEVPSQLDSFADKSAQKVFANLLAYTTRAQLTRLRIEEMLRIYAIFGVALDACAKITVDGAAISAKLALQHQCSRAVHNFFVQEAVDGILNLLKIERFAAFPAGRDDYPELNPYTPNNEVDHLTESIIRFLRGDATQANPFSIQNKSACQASVVANVDTSKVLHLFDMNPIFTMSSSTTCQRMIEFARSARYFPAVAAKVLDAIAQIAAVYIYFIIFHFVAGKEQPNIEEDPAVPVEHRNQAKRLRDLLSKCTGPAFPALAGAMCHEWKNKSAFPQGMFAASERGVALNSLEPVALCLKLCVDSISPLLKPDELSPMLEVVQAFSSLTKYSTCSGLRALANSVFPAETLYFQAVDRFRWDGPQNMYQACQSKKGTDPTASENSPYVKALLTQVNEVQAKLKEAYRDIPTPVVLHSTMELIIFNLLIAVPEALSRMIPRRFSEWGKLQLLADTLAMTRKIKDSFPLTSARLIESCVRYVMTLVHPVDAVQNFTAECHSYFTSKQLFALGDHEGPHRRRDIEAVLRATRHEDRIPYFLLDEV
jgi:hypothetical protein